MLSRYAALYAILASSSGCEDNKKYLEDTLGFAQFTKLIKVKKNCPLYIVEEESHNLFANFFSFLTLTFC